MSAHMPAAMGQPDPSTETPVTRHSPPIPDGARYRARRIGECQYSPRLSS